MVKKSFKIGGGLTKALDETVTSAKNNAGELHVEIIPLRKIALDPDNPRELLLTFKDLYEGIVRTDEDKKRKNSEIKSLSSIVNSIKEQGIINPILVYKHGEYYRLIAGERRTFGSILAKKIDIPAKILNAKPDLLKLSMLQWIENIERKDLSLWERLRNLVKILNAYANKQGKNPDEITATDLRKILGCSLQHAVNYRNILSGSDNLKELIKTQSINSIDKAAFIAKSPRNLESKLIQACINGNTLAQMKKIVNSKISNNKRTVRTPKTKINLGSTNNKKVAKIIFDSVIQNKSVQKHVAHLDTIDWDNNKSIMYAFNRLLKSLEQIKKS